MPKRTSTELSDVGYGDLDDGEWAKRQQPSSLTYSAELPAQQLEQIVSDAYDIVTELYHEMLTEGSTPPETFCATFSGLSQDFIREQLASGTPFEIALHPRDEVQAQYSEDDGEADEDELEDPRQYAQQLAGELCEEILTELVEQYLSEQGEDDTPAELLNTPELNELRADITKLAYDAVWEELGYEHA